MPPQPAHSRASGNPVLSNDEYRREKASNSAGGCAALAGELRSGIAGAGHSGCGRTVSARRSLARRAGLHLDHPDFVRPAGDRRHAARNTRAHQAGTFSFSGKENIAALAGARRNGIHRGPVRIRNRFRSRRRRCPARSRCFVAAARMDDRHDTGRTQGTRGEIPQPRGTGERRHPRLRRGKLERPSRQSAHLRRPRSDRHCGRRRTSRPLDCRAPASARHRHADCRPPSPRRRQLAHAVSLTDIAQRSACQSPALSAVPADISRLHSEGQAGELVRILRRGNGAEFLDGQRACRRTL